MKEEFRKVYIENYGYVTVNNFGTKVLNKDGKELSHRHNSDGYVFVRVAYGGRNGHEKMLLIHRLVGFAFIPNTYNYPEINHKDANKQNNCVSNLEWCTRQYNIDHAVRNGLMADKSGENNGNSILVENDVKQIRELYRNGFTKYKIAKMFGRGWTTISHIIKNETWKNID